MAQLKTCFKCLQKKPADDFYKHPRMADGRLGKCKNCARADVIANRNAKLDQYREYDRVRSIEPRRVAARRLYQETAACKIAARAAKNAWRHNHPHKAAAHKAVRNAVLAGRIVKGACETCGSERVHAHHDDYDRPLEIRWLCATHHAEHHKNLREQERKKSRAA